MNETEVVAWVASAVVGVIVAIALSKLNPKLAVIFGPAAALLAHQQFDGPVAGQIRHALR